MKKLTVMEERIAKIAKQEADFGCCSFRGECGMMLNARCEMFLLLVHVSAPDGHTIGTKFGPLKYLKFVISKPADDQQQMTDGRPKLRNCFVI